jgi:calpain-15
MLTQKSLIFLQVEDNNDGEVEAIIKEWICKRCTLENLGQSSICLACGGSKLKSLDSSPALTASATVNGSLKKGDFWNCPKCTLKNRLTVAHCRICETVRRVSITICSKCTYDNPTGSEQCALCETQLKDVKITSLQTFTSRPSSTTSMGSRHESELMEQLRKVEESAARDKWRNIVHFCKKVKHSSFNLSIIY